MEVQVEITGLLKEHPEAERVFLHSGYNIIKNVATGKAFAIEHPALAERRKAEAARLGMKCNEDGFCVDEYGFPYTNR